MKRKIICLAAIVCATTVVFTGCKNGKQMKKKFEAFVKQHDEKVKPLYKDLCIASWDAEISGKDEDFAKSEKLNIEYTKIFTNKEDFKLLKEIKESDKITDSIQKRQLDILYNSYLRNQVDPTKLEAIIKLETEIAKKYNNFRVVVGKDTLSDNEVEETLRTCTDNKKLQETWEASKKLGPVVAADIIKLVKMRNEVAKELGFSNYHEMSLKLGEQDPAEISKIFDELDNLTRDAFASVKNDVDNYVTKRLKITKDQLRPWDYQNRFFQEAPEIYDVDFEKYYKGKDLAKITANYFAGLGLPIEDLLKHSDLFEKPGKCQHAFCTHVDKSGDVRILCNIKDNSYWMGTMLHEFGHGVYDKNVDMKLPFELREPAHTFTTEAIAMIYGRMSSNGQWLQDNLGISEAEKNKISEIGFKKLQLEQLTFSRWAQVMYRFEKSMYENPDQDLNKLWWDICEKYQMIKRPDGRNMPDWATKTHIATSPCYYHNYLLGELLASQLHYYITKNIIKSEDLVNQSYSNNKEIGKFMIEKIFMPASRYEWNTMIEKATGEKLTAKYYAKQFVGDKK